MSSLKELRDIRIEKLHKLREMGVDPYPAKSYKTTDVKDVTENYTKLEGKEVTVAGRIVSYRDHSHLVFADLKDASGKVQIYIKQGNFEKANYANSELNFEDLFLLDLGDFIEVKGKVTKTQRGEISVEPTTIRILAKSLRPLPNSWDGLKDKETRLRKRYLDTNINPEVFQRYLRRAKFWEAHREFFKQKGFYEINIPVLEIVTGGADAKPFITHMDAIDQDFYLRISQELYLKRLIGGGYEKVYEVGPRFRNEGLSDEHLPEHMAMEFYWAYADWKDGMKMIQDLYDFVLKYVYNDKKQFKIRGFDVDFSKGWQIIDFGQIMKERYGIEDIYNISLEDLAQKLKENKIKLDLINIPRGVDALWKETRKTIAGPAFLINHPKFLSPLQKPSTENPMVVERFQPIIAGSELGNGWSELNDAIDQYNRFAEQQDLRDSGDDEAQMMDIDYVEMLEYGMPPTFGYGHSERVFWFLEDVSAREGVPFPQLKHELDESTIEIYGLKKPVAIEKPTKVIDPTLVATPSADSEPTSGLPTRERAQKLLEEHVTDDYQLHHSKMVAEALEAYAEKYGEDKDLWYITGLLHDLDYFEFPNEHPSKSVEWFKEWGYPEALIHAVQAHAHERSGIEPTTKLAACLCACDELSGFLYAYSLMRPEGWNGMQASSVKKKFKDKAFAAKISREDISYGIEKLGEDFDSHVGLLIGVFIFQPKNPANDILNSCINTSCNQPNGDKYAKAKELK